MKAIEKIYAVLLSAPGKRWTQVEIARRCGCSKAFLSKTCKGLIEKGIISRPYKNQLVLINFLGLLNEWVKVRRLPQAVFIETELSKEAILKKLRRLEGYALTLFSAAWLRTKYFQTNSIELYLEQNKLDKFIKRFGKKTTCKTSFMVLPVNEFFLEVKKHGGLRLVPDFQNYVDLMVVGGNSGKVALKLAEKEGWFD